MPPPAVTIASKRSLTARGSVSAPQKQAVRQERSALASEGSFVRASKSVGTPTSTLGRSVRRSFATISALNCGTRIDLPPAMNAALMHTPSPKPWKIGSTARMASFSPIPHHDAACMPWAMKLRLERTMPLGRPVVPPEKRMAAASFVLPAGGSVAGAAADSKAAHERTRGSAGTAGILRPLVTQNPRRLSGDRYSGMRATRIFSSGRFGVAAASVP